MSGSFSLSDLCGCSSPCPDCCGGCCPGVGTASMYATFSGFTDCGDPVGSYELAWDAVNQWWGKATATFTNGYEIVLWIECPEGGDGPEDYILHYEIWEGGGTPFCTSETDSSNVPPWGGQVCDPFELTFHYSGGGDCLPGECANGTITVTL